MTRPAFLSRPGIWTRTPHPAHRTPRTAQSPADYACAVEHNVKRRSPWGAADFAVAVIAVAVLAAIALGLL